MRSSALFALLVACASPPVATRPPPIEASAEKLFANDALVRDRYCTPIARLEERALDACGCTPDQRRDGQTTFEQLVSDCGWVSGRLPEDHVLHVDEVALASCLAQLDPLLVGCAHTRLPADCEVARIFGPGSEAIPLSRPIGADCREVNDDEGFDATYLCAEGLTCVSTCQVETAPPPNDCSNPLALPWR